MLKLEKSQSMEDALVSIECPIVVFQKLCLLVFHNPLLEEDIMESIFHILVTQAIDEGI